MGQGGVASKAFPGVEALEGLVSVVGLQKVAPAVLRGEESQGQLAVHAREQADTKIKDGCNLREQNSLPITAVNSAYGKFKRQSIGCVFG